MLGVSLQIPAGFGFVPPHGAGDAFPPAAGEQLLMIHRVCPVRPVFKWSRFRSTCRSRRFGIRDIPRCCRTDKTGGRLRCPTRPDELPVAVPLSSVPSFNLGDLR